MRICVLHNCGEFFGVLHKGECGRKGIDRHNTLFVQDISKIFGHGFA